MAVLVRRNETDPSDKSKGKKNWLFTKKKPTICSSHNNIKSPEAPFLTEEVIKQLKVLMKFLDKDESEFNNRESHFVPLIRKVHSDRSQPRRNFPQDGLGRPAAGPEVHVQPAQATQPGGIHMS